MRVLVIEDDKNIAKSICTALELAGFITVLEHDGEDGWYSGSSEPFDAIILDLGLPTLDGLTILKRWRRENVITPVLILTARGNWDERVDGIDAGADDYLVKPYRTEELVARIRALVRRAAGHAATSIQLGEFTLDTLQMRVLKNSQPIALTPQEYRLVAYLMHQCDRVVSQMELTQHLYSQDFERESNSVEVLVGRTRRKLGKNSIQTRRGFGYIMEKPKSQSTSNQSTSEQKTHTQENDL
ncbi:Two-component transcriptional response regulator, LuxR family [hydrothermal vent metagenome]|uniref:Two-component transcriptional response regulator, LuxR family n=1 Tax=hydrothermal vent metagenome TaxID=652676 RepID=A0A3B0UZF1_9ZZZZ